MSEPDLRAADALCEDKGEPFVTLVISASTDPLTRHGHKPRDPMYRLRLLLKRAQRDLGLTIRAHHNPLAEHLAVQPCPRCGIGLDTKGRCWRCYDWKCACGGWTGSAVISQCVPCQVAQKEVGS